MSKKTLTKEEIRSKLDGNELDLSLSNLAKVPVREIVCSKLITKSILLSI